MRCRGPTILVWIRAFLGRWSQDFANTDRRYSMSLTDAARKMGHKVEVLRDLEPIVHDMMAEHEKKRELWFPHDLLAAPEGIDPDTHLRELRQRVAGIPDAARAA